MKLVEERKKKLLEKQKAKEKVNEKLAVKKAEAVNVFVDLNVRGWIRQEFDTDKNAKLKIK